MCLYLCTLVSTCALLFPQFGELGSSVFLVAEAEDTEYLLIHLLVTALFLKYLFMSLCPVFIFFLLSGAGNCAQVSRKPDIMCFAICLQSCRLVACPFSFS